MSTKNNKTGKKKYEGFSEFEREAMQARAKELLAEARASKNNAQGERDILAAIAKMSEPDRSMAKRLHTLITKHAPGLSPKTWYSMPAYAKGDKVVCFFQAASKFKSRYASLGFSDTAKLDDGAMWPVAFALKKLTATEEAKIAALLKKGVR
ncbi:MAG: DUF1801 domain-containing protein [Patescibacteria group bacterium]|jgi:uncharacterized protein YdhG (YjbR/CyaY superfamily)